MMKLFLLILTIVYGKREWTFPIKVIPSYQLSQSVYVDTFTKIAHVIWCNDYKMYYLRFGPNNEISPTKLLDSPHTCFSRFIINGYNDGKSIFIVYEGRRKRIPGRCVNITDACNDIYFLESADGGISWSKEIAVPRRDLNDHEDREFPKLFITHQNRIWIFYRMSGLADAPYSYVTRSLGASVFSNEIKLSIRVQTSSIAYNYYNNQHILSIYYMRANDRTRYRYYTNNNG